MSNHLEPDVPACLTTLGLRPPLTLEDVKQAYLAKAMAMHPDRGGDPAEFVKLQAAFEEANDYVKFKASKLEWLASKIEAYAQQQEVATEAIERGGEIEMEETDWLRKSFGDDFGHVADKLVTVRLRNPSADDLFAILLGFRADSLKDLATLDLTGGSLTDEGKKWRPCHSSRDSRASCWLVTNMDVSQRLPSSLQPFRARVFSPTSVVVSAARISSSPMITPTSQANGAHSNLPPR
jgi:hypothetical protein